MSPLEIYLTLGNFWMYAMVILVPICFIAIHLQWFLMPKELVSRIRKVPHCNAGEVAVFELYPGKLIFSVIVGWMICFPNRNGRGRQMSDIRNHVPKWYQNYVFFHHYVILLGCGGSFLLSVAIMVIAKAMM